MTNHHRRAQRTVTLSEIKTIIDMTKKGCDRPEIARAIGRSTNTVWRYQKKYLC